MSGDMFRKMKERITDEVNSATDKLHSMQIIDHLAPSIGQQVLDYDSMPIPTLPELPPASFGQSNHDLDDICSSTDRFAEDDELNSEISPQHQLFNEQTIPRISPTPDRSIEPRPNRETMSRSINVGSTLESTVIDIQEISSDLDDDLHIPSDDSTINDNVEIDLLTDNQFLTNNREEKIINHGDNPRSDRMDNYMRRYRRVVHFLRKIDQDHKVERTGLESQIDGLKGVVTALRTELDALKQNSESLLSISTSASENDRASTSSTVHGGKTSSKIKDLEKLIAKCKESLKAKNNQLKIMRDTVAEIDQFKEGLDEIKQELGEIRAAHESWTISIAEGKRIMHQEIEDKNSEIIDLQHQLKESFSKSTQLRSIIQNLESRIVSTSVAHQKERESLIKEMTTAKNLALKQAHRDFELQLERVKLDLEKSIETLKSEILTKDEQIIRDAERLQELQENNHGLASELELTRKKLDNNLQIFEQLRQTHEQCSNEILKLKSISSDHELKIKSNDEVESKTKQMEAQIEDLRTKLSLSETQLANLETQLKAQEEKQNEIVACSQCEELRNQLSEASERHEQTIFDLNTQLNLMTTANSDQEKALNSLKAERDSLDMKLRMLKVELDEQVQKNETLARVNRDNDIEMQNQQEQLDNLTSIQQALENLRKDHQTQSKNFDQLKSELNDRNSELGQSRAVIDKLRSELDVLDTKATDLTRVIGELKSEKDAVMANHLNDKTKRMEIDQQLIVSILSAIKNLETPNTSPGSDKTYEPEQRQSLSENSDDERNLPDPLALAEKLASIALDRSNVQLRTSQRLQAVLLENTMMTDQLNRLREELNAISKEKAEESICSLNEAERLQTENQALIHDRQAYEDQIASLEEDLEVMSKQLESMRAESLIKVPTIEASTGTEDTNQNISESNKKSESRDSRDCEIEELKKIIEDKERQLRNFSDPNTIDIPDSTQFEYLKNIVYHFMLGKEPLVLARVISAVFKFDKSQVDQICKVQEAVQAALKPSI